ncbi:MAG: GNAT family N-acetyltransferase [Caldilineales bacterium]
MDTTLVSISDNPEAGRFEALYGGDVVGYITYQTRDGVMRLPHTYVTPAARGQNVAALLTDHALRAARVQRLRVVPICWYVDRYIQRHPQYHDLLGDPATLQKGVS